MRINNSLKNMYFGIVGQCISLILGFVTRTVFIMTLGVEYLGIDGLFSSILLVLSLANLGFDNAMVYSLYRPLAEKDTHKINALMNLYRKAYITIGVIILIIGLAISPFLPFIIKDDVQINNLYLIYILFLINSTISYFLAYKHSIIIADQQQHIITRIHTNFSIIYNVIVIMFLLLTEEYILILCFQIFIKIIENYYITKKADKMYSYIKRRNAAKLTQIQKKDFFEKLYALFLYKISGVVINSTDNIIISKFVGVTSVGIYSNYLLIISTVSSFLSQFFYSIKSSVGNLIVSGDNEKNYFIFRIIFFASFWFFGLSSVLLWNFLNPFISLWLGEPFLFNKLIIFALILNFFTTGMQNASATFRETTGLFLKGKYRPIFAAVINIVASLFLVQKIGIAGVFFGTVFSRLCTYFWFDPYIIYKDSFEKPVKQYFISYLKFVFLVVIACIVTNYLGGLYYQKSLLYLFIHLISTFFITNVVFYIFYRKAEEFLYLKNILLVNVSRLNKYFRIPTLNK